MQVVSKLDNISIFSLTEKRMAGIVYDWWMGPSDEERTNVAIAGSTTLELSLKTQLVPEPVDENKQLIIDLARMELKDIKFLDQFGNDYMAKIYKANLTNDSTQKISFLSKLPGNLGDLILKDLEVQGKNIEQTLLDRPAVLLSGNGQVYLLAKESPRIFSWS